LPPEGIAALATDDLQGMTAKSIFALAQSGHPQATSLVHRSAQTIARLIADMKASCLPVCRPGGSIGWRLGYIHLVERYLAQEPAVYHTPIVAAHYQHDAGLIGAALLAEDKAL
jgi:N-acylmannosamine kinase